MISMRVDTQQSFARVKKAADAAQYRNFGHAAASLRKAVAQSIVKADGPSAPGKPPHTHKRIFLRRALRFHVNRGPDGDAVIGPRASIVGDVGMVHEFGGRRGDEEYPARPFMFPALEAAAPRFAEEWAGTIGE